jgi:hypothetical protein
MPRPARRRPLVPAGGPYEPALAQTERAADARMPAPLVGFDGVGQAEGPIPPDTNGDVGPAHYVQYTNGGLLVFSRTGKVLLGPLPSNAPWQGFGGPCEQTADGDTIVLYDGLADRWLLSEFAQPNYPSGPFYQCVAVSRTGDPAGSYFRYEFEISKTKLNDYPKLGVWPDGYYMSANQFDGPSASDYAGAALVAFDRAKMLAGDPSAGMLYVDGGAIDPLLGGMLPADVDGTRPPPEGAPEPFVEVDDAGFFAGPDHGAGEGGRTAGGFTTDEISILRFHADWADPASSAVEGPIELPTRKPIDFEFCGGDEFCIPQPGTSARLDALPAQVMHRVAYRNFGDHESLVLDVTVDAGGDRAGIHWFELRGVSTSPSIYQEGVYAPGSVNRFMGSLAMDGNGDIAAGYSVSSSTVYPSLRYAGRLASDPLGVFGQGEATLVAGGSQLDPSGRFGDYSSMSIDPADDCTFWFTGEYYPKSSVHGYSTRIAAFAFGSCDATPPEVRALPAKGRSGRPVTLRFRVNDNKGEARARIVVRDGAGRVLRTAGAGLAAATGGVRSVVVEAPRAPGSYEWCVTATDRRRNASESCAALRVRA